MNKKERDVIQELIDCLENWVEIADECDRRRYDREALDDGKALLQWYDENEQEAQKTKRIACSLCGAEGAELVGILKNQEKLKSEILPCPHCGGQATVFTALGDYWVDCFAQCRMAKDTRDEAIADWNRRAGKDDQ